MKKSTVSAVMVLAWKKAREAAAKFAGTKASEYIAECMKEAWAEQKAAGEFALTVLDVQSYFDHYNSTGSQEERGAMARYSLGMDDYLNELLSKMGSLATKGVHTLKRHCEAAIHIMVGDLPEDF